MSRTSFRFQTICALSVFAATLGAQPVSARHADIVDTAVEAGSFKTLAAALKAAGLVDALKGKGPFTVFAPTDEAFAKLPKGTVEKLLLPENKGTLAAILKYHVVSGSVTAKKVVKLSAAKTLNGQRVDIVVDHGKVKVDGATVIKADVKASNGVIHVIDKVVLPSSANIVETAVKAGSFKTLATALQAAALVETLQGKGPFTVFAPTDDAFAKLPEGTVESLVQPANIGKLKAILAYHVVPGRVFSTDLKSGSEAKTVQGGPIAIKISPKGVWINNSKVVKADVNASNGVIHVIDSVLMPPAEKTAAATSSRGRRLIELAIERGAQMYNAGDARGCAAVYEVAAQGLMALSTDDLCSSSRQRMKTTVASAGRVHDMGRRAWMLRHALDSAYVALSY